MNELLFHPRVVHVPIALSVLMPLVAGGLGLAWWRGWLPARSWIVAVALQAVLLGSGVLAIRTGQAEEDRVERVVPESAIEEHEEAAEVFLWSAGGVLGVMALALAGARRRAGLPIAAAATLGTLVVLGLGYRTGKAGGELVYRHGAARAYAAADVSPATEGAGHGGARGRDE